MKKLRLYKDVDVWTLERPGQWRRTFYTHAQALDFARTYLSYWSATPWAAALPGQNSGGAERP